MEKQRNVSNTFAFIPRRGATHGTSSWKINLFLDYSERRCAFHMHKIWCHIQKPETQISPPIVKYFFCNNSNLRWRITYILFHFSFCWTLLCLKSVHAGDKVVVWKCSSMTGRERLWGLCLKWSVNMVAREVNRWVAKRGKKGGSQKTLASSQY